MSAASSVFREGGSRPDTTATYVYEGAKSGQGQTVDWSGAADLARAWREHTGRGTEAALDEFTTRGAAALQDRLDRILSRSEDDPHAV